jgi:HPt (histidine-containing phosphotransfer) domain-containing protein
MKLSAQAVERFIERRRLELEQISLLIEKEDFSTIQRLGHSLKGSGKMFGFEDLGLVGARLEDAAAGRDMRAILACHAELKAWVAQKFQ